MISVVFPLINPNDPWGSTHDYDYSNDASINEGLYALVDAVSNGFPTGFLEDQVITEWQFQWPGAFLNPTLWDIRLLVGTTYATNPYLQDGIYEVWTDIAPAVGPGDFNGDGAIDEDDEALYLAFLQTVDGTIADEDGVVNDVFDIIDHPYDFSLHDTNGDGFVDSRDFFIGVFGDMDGNGLVDLGDFAFFQNCQTGPHDPAGPSLVSTILGDCRAADMDVDGDVDCDDLGGFRALCIEGGGGIGCLFPIVNTDDFVNELLAGSPDPCIADLNGDGAADGQDLAPFVTAVLAG